MKKFIIYVVFIFVVAFSGYFIYGYMQSAKYDGTAVPYIEKVLPELSSWDVDRVTQFMVPEILATISHVDLSALLKSLSRLGTLESSSEITFKSKTVETNVKYADAPVVTYTIEAEYSSGPVTVTLGLLDRNGDYQVYSFNFQSQALATQ